MSKEHLTRVDAYTKLGAVSPPKQDSEWITKREAVAAGADTYLLDPYPLDDYPVDDHILPGISTSNITIKILVTYELWVDGVYIGETTHDPMWSSYYWVGEYAHIIEQEYL